MEYTWAALSAVAVVVAVELLWLRTGIFTTVTYWVAYGIVLFFQVLVDGWLTKLSAPIVLYNPDKFTEWRAPFDIPVEDYLFGFAMVTLAIMLWVRATRRSEPAELLAAGPGRDGGAEPPNGRTGTQPIPPR